MYTNDNIIYTNNNQIFIIDVLHFTAISNFTVDSEITSIRTIDKFLAVTTKNKLYLYNSYILIDSFPIASDGYFNITDIDNNKKPNLLSSKKGFIYNYELAN